MALFLILSSGSEALKSDFRDRLFNLRRIRPLYLIVAIVMPSTVIRGTPEDAPYSYALAVPTDAPGLRFLCRESFDLGPTPITLRVRRRGE